jgi:hypothetical protein
MRWMSWSDYVFLFNGFSKDLLSIEIEWKSEWRTREYTWKCSVMFLELVLYYIFIWFYIYSIHIIQSTITFQVSPFKWHRNKFVMKETTTHLGGFIFVDDMGWIALASSSLSSKIIMELHQFTRRPLTKTKLFDDF